MKFTIRFCLFSSLLTLFSCLDVDVQSSNEQLGKDIQLIDSYLESNNITPLYDISGLRFKIDSVGSYYTAQINGTVTFDYVGKLLDGTIFDSGTLTNRKVSELIPGMQIGLLLLPEGSKAKLYIPSVYAYGSNPPGSIIPKNANLIFEVFMRDVIITPTELTQLNNDTLLIDSYISENNITDVVKDSTGVRYKYINFGNGSTVDWFNKVKFSYSGYLINANKTKGALISTGTSEPSNISDSRVVNFLRGFQIGLTKLKEGDQVNFYIPSIYAFGANTFQSNGVTVPANASLIYEVTLLDVLDP